jgi:hypothetical protein
MGEEFPNDPGSSTWAYKTLRGVTVDTYTETETNTLKAKRTNYYVQIAGVNTMLNGVTPAGEWIDVTIGIHWLTARLQERLFTTLVNVKKVPYTDKGISLIEGAVRAMLREAVRVGFLDDDENLSVTVPAAADATPADRAARVLQPVDFQGRIAGAIHEIVLNGTVTV